MIQRVQLGRLESFSRLQLEPVERMRAEGEKVRGLFHPGKSRAAEEFDKGGSLIPCKVQSCVLNIAGKIDHHQQMFAFVTTDKGQDAGVVRLKKFKRAAAKGLEAFPQPNHAPHPPQQRMLVTFLGLDIDDFIMVFRVDDDRQV